MMSAPNMATLTASLERSLRNCSLNHHTSPSAAIAASSSSSSSSTGLSRSNSSDDASRLQPSLLQDLSSSNSPPTCDSTTTTLVDLNSNVSLPYHWEQCLDLQTGEIYYRNWRNGMKAKEDPRLITRGGCCEGVQLYETEDEDDEEEDDTEDEEEEDEDESYDSEGSSNTCNSYSMMGIRDELAEDVLVVAGCKSCLMYYMVPKHVVDCPKCTGHLLHFDRHSHGD